MDYNPCISHYTPLHLNPHLVRSPPVLPVVDEHAPPEHAHHLGEVFVGVRVPGNLVHDRARRAPSLVIGRFSHLRLHLRVRHHHIGPVASKATG